MENLHDKTGRSYEAVVRAIFQAILDQEEVTNVIVEHDVTLQGKTTPHQIDVYWKFVKGGVTYETVVQVKDWRTPVKQAQLFEFKSVLNDLPRQPRGIFVTHTGYQRGARAVAKAEGIILYELGEEPPLLDIVITTLGWATMKPELRSFQVPSASGGTQGELALGFKSTIYQPRFSNITFQLDTPWFDQNPLTNQIDKSQLKFPPIPLAQIVLYDSDYNPIDNVEAVVRKELEIIRNEKIDTKHVVHIFEKDTFFGPDYTGFTYIKINKIAFDVVIDSTERPARFKLKNFAKLVLREIPSGEERTFLVPKQ
jgi:Restriction endonuclease